MSDEDASSDNQPNEQPAPVDLPPQSSPSDTSNQDNQVIISPDGLVHIKDLGSDDSITNK